MREIEETGRGVQRRGCGRSEVMRMARVRISGHRGVYGEIIAGRTQRVGTCASSRVG